MGPRPWSSSVMSQPIEPIDLREPGACTIVSCETPFDDARPVYYSGDPGTVPLRLCQNHRPNFPEYQLLSR